jgi:oxygen-dependent protoporphyrinogen oxidase
VGGGISGLALANRILEESQRLQRPVELKLLEAGHRLGGVIQTVEHDGFVLEGGPDSFISEKPWAVALCRRLGLEKHLIATRELHRRSFVVRKGKLLPVPEGFYLLAPTQLWPMVTTSIFSWSGKLRMAADLFLPRKRWSSPTQDESLASFVQRRLGREALERIAQPMVGGIYTADPAVLGLRATMPRFLEMEREHRSLILAMLRSRRNRHSEDDVKAAGPRYGVFVSLDRGMESLVEALRKRVPHESLHLNAPVSALKQSASTKGWVLKLQDGSDMEADAVCLALPACASAELLEPLDAPLAARLRNIPYASTATINLAYRETDIPRPLEGFGFVVPAIEKREILACTFSHLKFPNRAPQGSVLLRVFIGGTLQPEAFEHDDETMIRIVRHNLNELLGIQKSPLFTLIERHSQAMPQYGVGHLELVAHIEAQLRKHPALRLAGNAFTGIGIPDCVNRGETCADSILNELFEPPAGPGVQLSLVNQT